MIREAGRGAERVRGAVRRCETFCAEGGRDMGREAGKAGREAQGRGETRQAGKAREAGPET